LASQNRAHVTLLHVIHHVPDIPLGELGVSMGAS